MTTTERKKTMTTENEEKKRLAVDGVPQSAVDAVAAHLFTLRYDLKFAQERMAQAEQERARANERLDKAFRDCGEAEVVIGHIEAYLNTISVEGPAT